VHDAQLDGDLIVPEQAHRLVIFAHGSGSSRFSGLESLRRGGAAPGGGGDAAYAPPHPLRGADRRAGCHPRFDIALLADRLVAAAQFASLDPRTMSLPACSPPAPAGRLLQPPHLHRQADKLVLDGWDPRPGGVYHS
jgi:hypothetical protein